MSLGIPEIATRVTPRGQAKARALAFEAIPHVPPSPIFHQVELISQPDALNLYAPNGETPIEEGSTTSAKSEKRRLAESENESQKANTLIYLSPIPQCNPSPSHYEIDLFSQAELATPAHDTEHSDEPDSEEVDSELDAEEAHEANTGNVPAGDVPPPYVESVAPVKPAIAELKLDENVQQPQEPATTAQSKSSYPSTPATKDKINARPLRQSNDVHNDNQLSTTIPGPKRTPRDTSGSNTSSGQVSDSAEKHGKQSRSSDPPKAPRLPREQTIANEVNDFQQEVTAAASRTANSSIRQARRADPPSGKEVNDIHPVDSSSDRNRQAQPALQPSSSKTRTPGAVHLPNSISAEGKDGAPVLGPTVALTGSPVQIAQSIPLPTADLRSSSDETRLFAFVIGITQYQDWKLDTLRGPVRDAVSFRDYFEDELHVSESRMIALFDEQATRSNIINAFERMATNPDIRKGDPVVIFYAGLASNDRKVANTGAGVQMILPYDFSGTLASAITNRQFEKLIMNIAQNKGDNITVILSCSHSGSFTSARSHMLITACGASEKATESDDRGRFSVALLKLLKKHPMSDLRYSDVLTLLEHVPGQNPQCMGRNQHRILFDTRVIHPTRSFPVSFREGNRTRGAIEAGFAQGIIGGARFTIYSADDHGFENPLGVVSSKSVSDFTTTLQDFPDVDVATQSYVAVQSEAGTKEPLRLFIPRDTAAYALFKAVGLDGITLVENQSIAHLKAAMFSDQGLLFEAMDNRIARYGINLQYGPVNINDWNKVTWTLGRAAHFFSELDGLIGGKTSNPPVRLEFYELDWFESDDLQPVGDNLYNEDVINVFSNQGIAYGVKLINESPYDLYPYLFLFDCVDLSIKDYYLSPGLHDSPYAHDIPLQKENGSLTVGYGFGGGNDPFYFDLKEGQNLNISFLKLIFSTTPLDLHHLPQPSPFQASRAMPPTIPSKPIQFLPKHPSAGDPQGKPNDRWGSVVIPVIQRRQMVKFEKRD